MSYDLTLKDPVTGKTLTVESNHLIVGGTYRVGGTRELWLSMTFNYAPILTKVLEDGIDAIHGKSGTESIAILNNAIAKLGDDATDDYWEPTEGNVKRALFSVKAMAELRPDGIWEVER